MTDGLMTLLIAVLAGTVSVIAALLCLRWLDERRRSTRSSRNALLGEREPIIFLFRGRNLVDATLPAKSIAGAIGDDPIDLPRLTAWLDGRFPEFSARLPTLPAKGRIELTGGSGTGIATLRLVAEDLGQGTTRLTISDPGAENAGIMVDSLTLQAMEEELDLLRGSMNHTPMMAWRQDSGGTVTWANAAYLKRAEQAAQEGLSWPLPPKATRACRAGHGWRRAGRCCGSTAMRIARAIRPCSSPCLPMPPSGPSGGCANSSRP